MARVSLLLLPVLLSVTQARIHRLFLRNETRFVVHLNTFGYFVNGTLEVKLVSLQLPAEGSTDSSTVGFSLARSRVNGVLSYTAEDTETCTLLKSKSDDTLILFTIDPHTRSVEVKSFNEKDSTLTGYKEKTQGKEAGKGEAGKGEAGKGEAGKGEAGKGEAGKDEAGKGEAGKDEAGKDAGKEVKEKSVETEVVSVTGKEMYGLKLALIKFKENSYNFTFNITIGAEDQGLYNLNFHNCRNMRPGVLSPYSLNVEIVEKNPAGFLSAAEIPLPRLYISMAAMFLTAAVVWTYTLLKHRYSVFKIHWLMAALAYTKTISLVFHSINYHFINKEGHPIEGWAVMYYITHLLKGALLFITLALIGTGFAFVKYILSDKEKKIFMIVIPLQVLANVAYIIIEETEEASSEYALWREILFLVDLICCGAILFPVVWSIRHLQEASTTDGKAAINLEKLKLFRHYYVMIVCYIYFTRIIAILLKVTVPFQWQWCQEFLIEVSTLVFFVLTGFKFRPASNNPYLQLPQDEEDLEMDEVVTESGALEGISKVKKTSNGRERQRDPAL
ncbi:protein GPR108 isoform X13 [Astyanax mexicanus]|uniref:protein GPR108 isoform X11 n=1 Tax=Astyanax mexicanus TaxID=7994 RepID=UPI0020CB3514|nr:protein GPR108 isoform X11 [Astyanax mexicanus]XP_049325385.1 protein GPR108 isoform X13 [Astyanax mexicanus]